MAQCNKSHFTLSLLASMLGLVVSLPAWPADNVAVNFKGKIISGQCDITLSDSVLSFGLHRQSTFSASQAVAILPLSATVECNESNQPLISVSGNTPHTGVNTVFRDGPGAANGAGFMVRQDVAGLTPGNFYLEASAMENNVNVPTTGGVLPANTLRIEPFMVGLVQARGTGAVQAGPVTATVTFNVVFN